MTQGESDFFKTVLPVFACPKCSGDLSLDSIHFVCGGCGEIFGIYNGIPQLYWQNGWDGTKEDVTETIKAFYEKTPFPNYDEFDNAGILISKARRGGFAKLLDDQIPFGSLILECGCGTGQLSNFLSMANRTVFGTDICINSLKMARDFKEKNDLKRAHFIQMNLFRPCFKARIFDLVISNGVLHHTSDPFLAFKTISTLVRPGGYLLVGLYHKYGRIMNDVRKFLFHITKDRFKFIDAYLRLKSLSDAKRAAWFMDQYKNPHESKHTIKEVVGWINDIGFRYINCIPKITPFAGFSWNEKLFEQNPVGKMFERWFVDIGMAFSGRREGGFFIVISQSQI